MAVWWLAGAAGLYLAATALLFLFQRKLLYFPHRGAVVPADYGVGDMRMVPVRTADGLTVSCWFRGPMQEGRPTVVLLPGNAGHLGIRAHKARALMDEGYGVLMVGYRGYGGNPGTPSEKGLVADARAALDFLVGLGISGTRMVMYGESLGSSIALQLAIERRAGVVVLEAPATSMSDVAAATVPFFPIRWLLLDRFDCLSRIAEIRSPLLIIHGERDTIVPIRFGRTLFERAAEPKRAHWLPDAGHNDLARHGSIQLVLDYLEELGRKGPAMPPPVIEQETRKGTGLVRT